jgi:hypothetical protein
MRMNNADYLPKGDKDFLCTETPSAYSHPVILPVAPLFSLT